MRIVCSPGVKITRTGLESIRPNPERFAALLDFFATDSQMAEWVASAAKYRTVVSNSTIHEITK